MKFRKRPIVIEAIQWTGYNFDEISRFTQYAAHSPSFEMDTVTIPTLEGDMVAHEDDWIIKGVEGEFYPCKPGIFAKTYEAIEEEGINAAAEEIEKLKAEIVVFQRRVDDLEGELEEAREVYEL